MIERIEIKGVEARRYIELLEIKNYKISINHNTSIKSVRKKETKAEIDFSFITNYLPIGMIKIEGCMHYKGRVDELFEEWSREHRIVNKEVATEVLNVPLAFCMPLVFALAKELNLPPPLPLPRLKFGEEKKIDKESEKQAYL